MDKGALVNAEKMAESFTLIVKTKKANLLP